MENIKFSRQWEMPNAWTFKIKKIKELLDRYVLKEEIWIDPFSGENSPAKFRNDINKERNAEFNFDALDFCKNIETITGIKEFDGILFDPPYSSRQISEHYKEIGKKVNSYDTSSAFYSNIKNTICDNIKIGGKAISFGWNSGGFGKNRGFKIIEIMLINHGGAKNDTIVTVEEKIFNINVPFKIIETSDDLSVLYEEQCTKEKFEWQDEYFAVSVSESAIDKVRNYIKNQEEHHSKKTFQEEYEDFISKYGFEKFKG